MMPCTPSAICQCMISSELYKQKSSVESLFTCSLRNGSNTEQVIFKTRKSGRGDPREVAGGGQGSKGRGHSEWAALCGRPIRDRGQEGLCLRGGEGRLCPAPGEIKEQVVWNKQNRTKMGRVRRGMREPCGIFASNSACLRVPWRPRRGPVPSRALLVPHLAPSVPLPRALRPMADPRLDARCQGSWRGLPCVILPLTSPCWLWREADQICCVFPAGILSCHGLACVW